MRNNRCDLETSFFSDFYQWEPVTKELETLCICRFSHDLFDQRKSGLKRTTEAENRLLSQ